MHASVVVDTSVWISHIVPFDVNHTASEQWVVRYTSSGSGLLAPELLVIEVAAAMSRRTGHSVLGHGAVQNLIVNNQVSLIPMERSLVDRAAKLAADLRLRAADALYVALADHLTIPLVSWDNEQLQRASNLIKTYTPGSYPF